MTFEQFSKIGYTLRRNVVDTMGNKHKFGIYPDNTHGGGGINYFDNMIDLDIWYYEVLQNRASQNGEYEKAYRLNTIVFAKKNHINVASLITWYA